VAKYHSNHQSSQKSRYRINEQIRISPILTIGVDGEKIGVISADEARRRAREAGLDLVEISPTARPPVCRIMDFGKFKYEQSLKEKQGKQKGSQLKELRLSPRIADNDIEIKCNAARKFLAEGHKVQLKLKYHRRELAHKDLGFKIINRIVELLSDVGVAQQGAKLMDGNSLSCIVEPKQKETNDKPASG
jgi:translation initiation factor IF-3